MTTGIKPVSTDFTVDMYKLKDNNYLNTVKPLKLFSNIEFNKHHRRSSSPNSAEHRSYWSYTIPKYIEQYFRHSSSHGLKYVGDSTISYGERFLWLLVFLMAVSGASYFIYDLYNRFDSNPIIVSINPSPTRVEDFPFPAITICNMNAAKKSEAELILKNGSLTDRSFLGDICELDSSLISAHAVDNQTGKWENVMKFITKVSQPCEEMLKVCQWRLKDVDCNRIFKTIITDEGLCCTFNLLPMNRILKDSDTYIDSKSSFNYYQIDDWNPERGYAENASDDVFPFRCPGPGAHLGLTLVLDAKIDDYFCSSGSSLGFRLLLHNPAEIPKMTDFAFMTAPGHEARVVFKPIIYEATDDLQLTSIRKRQCYFNTERPLKFFRTYTKINCKMECLSNFTLERCGCVPYYLPRAANIKVCGKLQEACSDKIREMMDLKEISSREHNECNCLPACFQLDYEKTMSYGTISDNLRLKHNILSDSSPAYFKENMVILQFYFVNSQFTKYTKSEIFGLSELLSNVGGLLGFFGGFSIISAVEIIYYMTLKLLCNNLRVKRKNGRKVDNDYSDKI